MKFFKLFFLLVSLSSCNAATNALANLTDPINPPAKPEQGTQWSFKFSVPAQTSRTYCTFFKASQNLYLQTFNTTNSPNNSPLVVFRTNYTTLPSGKNIEESFDCSTLTNFQEHLTGLATWKYGTSQETLEDFPDDTNMIIHENDVVLAIQKSTNTTDTDIVAGAWINLNTQTNAPAHEGGLALFRNPEMYISAQKTETGIYTYRGTENVQFYNITPLASNQTQHLTFEFVTENNISTTYLDEDTFINPETVTFQTPLHKTENDKLTFSCSIENTDTTSLDFFNFNLDYFCVVSALYAEKQNTEFEMGQNYYITGSGGCSIGCRETLQCLSNTITNNIERDEKECYMLANPAYAQNVANTVDYVEAIVSENGACSTPETCGILDLSNEACQTCLFTNDTEQYLTTCFDINGDQCNAE